MDSLCKVAECARVQRSGVGELLLRVLVTVLMSRNLGSSGKEIDE